MQIKRRKPRRASQLGKTISPWLIPRKKGRKRTKAREVDVGEVKMPVFPRWAVQ